MQITKIIKIIFAILFILLVTQPSRDPDLGWHLRYGQYFFQYGHVLRDNIVSYIWPQYKWVQASWGFDLIIYQLFTHFGFLGLSIVSGACTFITFLIITWPHKRLNLVQLLFLGIIFIALVGPMWGGGLRTPTISTIFMALAIVISDRLLHPERERVPHWYMWILPVMFLVWANLHGGFALGLILLTIQWVSTGVIRKARNIPFAAFWTHGIALAASWLTPILNPWGIRIYEETFKHTVNTNLLGISEWAPLTDTPTEAYIAGFLVIFTLIILWWHAKIRALPQLIMILITAYLAFSANRFVIVLGVLVVYQLARALPRIQSKVFNRRGVQWGIAIALILFVIVDEVKFQAYFTFPNPRILRYSWRDYCAETMYCSEDITSIMIAHPPTGHGFHIYNYGGYLSWRVPQVQTFIDGRMAAWEENGKTPPILQGDWMAMPGGPVAFIKYDHDYQFNWAIVPTSSDINQYLDKLVQTQLWERLYQDSVYSYYRKITVNKASGQ